MAPREPDEDGLEEELIDDPQMNLGDQWGMKRMLDEKAIVRSQPLPLLCICKLLSPCAQLTSGRLRGPQEVLEDLGYETDWAIWNVKMVLGVISCVCAGVAQLWPGEYPETMIVLMVCCGIYYAAAVWLQYIASFQECGWFVFTKPKPTAKWSTTAGIALTSTMERYEYEYTLSVEVRPGSDTQLPVCRPSCRRSPLATSLPAAETPGASMV